MPWVFVFMHLITVLAVEINSNQKQRYISFETCCPGDLNKLSPICTFPDLQSISKFKPLTVFDIKEENYESSSLSANVCAKFSGSTKVTIQLVSYCTEDILSYALPVYILNSGYAEVNSYGIRLYGSHTEGNVTFEPRDHRWDRVKLLLDILNEKQNVFAETLVCDYYVWFDADLVFLNHSMKLERIISDYRDADIIISAELHAETGVANTGCFIIRNSEWSRRFLYMWWNNFDRSLHHDQIYFDQLYKTLRRSESDFEGRIAILPAAALNSHPPAMFFQRPTDPVLHLMGESEAIRSQVFTAGLRAVCAAYQHPEQHPLPPQLGLSRSFLQAVTFNQSVAKLRQHREHFFHDSIMRRSIRSDSSKDLAADNLKAHLRHYQQAMEFLGSSREALLRIQSIVNWQNDQHGFKDDLIYSLESIDVVGEAYRLFAAAELLLRSFDCIRKKGFRLPVAVEVELLNMHAVIGNDVLFHWQIKPSDDPSFNADTRALRGNETISTCIWGEAVLKEVMGFVAVVGDRHRVTYNRGYQGIIEDSLRWSIADCERSGGQLCLLLAINGSLHRLRSLIQPQSYVSVDEMLALNYHNMGLLWQRKQLSFVNQSSPEAQNHRIFAFNALSASVQLFTDDQATPTLNPYHALQPMLSLAIFQCQQSCTASETCFGGMKPEKWTNPPLQQQVQQQVQVGPVAGLQTLLRLLSLLQDKLLFAEQQWKAEHAVLAESLAELGICLCHLHKLNPSGGGDSTASSLLTLAMDYYQHSCALANAVRSAGVRHIPRFHDGNPQPATLLPALDRLRGSLASFERESDKNIPKSLWRKLYANETCNGFFTPQKAATIDHRAVIAFVTAEAKAVKVHKKYYRKKRQRIELQEIQ